MNQWLEWKDKTPIKMRRDRKREAIIEECARVAEAWDLGWGDSGIPKSIARAIRALKDKAMNDARDAQYEHLYEARKAINDRNSIIEECARVADEHIKMAVGHALCDGVEVAESIVVAIRVLKDKP